MSAWTASLGIIGGADGPTAVFVSGGPGALWVPLLLLAAAVLLVVFLRKRKKK